MELDSCIIFYIIFPLYILDWSRPFYMPYNWYFLFSLYTQIDHGHIMELDSAAVVSRVLMKSTEMTSVNTLKFLEHTILAKFHLMSINFTRFTFRSFVLYTFQFLFFWPHLLPLSDLTSLFPLLIPYLFYSHSNFYSHSSNPVVKLSVICLSLKRSAWREIR